MQDNYEIVDLLKTRQQLESLLGELIYGTPEIRDRNGKKYLYAHRRVDGKQVSYYVGEYSEELHNLLLNNNKKTKPLTVKLKEIDHRLRELGFVENDLKERVKRNIDFAKRHLALIIYSQAILEGVATTFADTEKIIEGGQVAGMTGKDIQKIVNMKHAWEFILDEDVITAPQDLTLLCQINRLVEETFYYNAGKIRDIPVTIGGTSWHPEIPVESQIKEELTDIVERKCANLEKAMRLALYVMRKQIFIDGDKRTAIIFANHFLVSKGLGLIVIPEDATESFKQLLIKYYENLETSEILRFMEEKCVLKI